MKAMLLITFLSVVTATIFMSGGYGQWEKDLTLEGTITVTVPEPESDGGLYVDSTVSTDTNVGLENSLNVGTEGDINDIEATSNFSDDSLSADPADISQSTDTKENVI